MAKQQQDKTLEQKYKDAEAEANQFQALRKKHGEKYDTSEYIAAQREPSKIRHQIEQRDAKKILTDVQLEQYEEFKVVNHTKWATNIKNIIENLDNKTLEKLHKDSTMRKFLCTATNADNFYNKGFCMTDSKFQQCSLEKMVALTSDNTNTLLYVHKLIHFDELEIYDSDKINALTSNDALKIYECYGRFAFLRLKDYSAEKINELVSTHAQENIYWRYNGFETLKDYTVEEIKKLTTSEAKEALHKKYDAHPWNLWDKSSNCNLKTLMDDYLSIGDSSTEVPTLGTIEHVGDYL